MSAKRVVHHVMQETIIRLVNGRGSVKEQDIVLCGAKSGCGDGRKSKVTCPKCKALLKERKP